MPNAELIAVLFRESCQTLCGPNAEVQNVKARDMCNKNCTLKVLRRGKKFVSVCRYTEFVGRNVTIGHISIVLHRSIVFQQLVAEMSNADMTGQDHRERQDTFKRATSSHKLHSALMFTETGLCSI
jgi:hypothetical protein